GTTAPNLPERKIWSRIATESKVGMVRVVSANYRNLPVAPWLFFFVQQRMIVPVMCIAGLSAVLIGTTGFLRFDRASWLFRTALLILSVLFFVQWRMVVTVVRIAGQSAVLIGFTGRSGLLRFR